MGQGGQAGFARTGQWGCIQQLSCLHRQDASRILRGLWRCAGQTVQAARGQLGPAAQAGPETCLFGLGRQFKEPAVLLFRGTYFANRAAVKAGGGNAGKKTPIKAGIPGLERQVVVF